MEFRTLATKENECRIGRVMQDRHAEQERRNHDTDV